MFRGVKRLVRPPRTRRSAALFHLRFRFVRVVRGVHAGEAKLHGRMTIVVLIIRPPRCEYSCVCVCVCLFLAFRLAFADICMALHGFRVLWVLELVCLLQNSGFYSLLDVLCAQLHWVLSGTT